MSPWHSTLRFLPLVATLVLGGCSDDDATPPFNICDDFETPYTAFAAGMTASGANDKIRVRLVAAEPAPPRRGANSWTLQVLDSNEEPLSGAQLSKVKPFMPDHGHGTSTIAKSAGVEIADLDCKSSPTACRAQPNADGTFDVSDIDLRMAGVWTVTVTAALADGSSDDATFAFCIDG